MFGCSLNADNFRSEVHSDVISGVFVDPTGVKAHLKFDDFRSNRSRDIRSGGGSDVQLGVGQYIRRPGNRRVLSRSRKRCIPPWVRCPGRSPGS